MAALGMDELFLHLRFPKRAQRVNWTNSSIILCPKSGHEPFGVVLLHLFSVVHGRFPSGTIQKIRHGAVPKVRH